MTTTSTSKAIATTRLVIGGGPGGQAAAIRVQELGIPTGLAEGRHRGGT